MCLKKLVHILMGCREINKKQSSACHLMSREVIPPSAFQLTKCTTSALPIALKGCCFFCNSQGANPNYKHTKVPIISHEKWHAEIPSLYARLWNLSTWLTGNRWISIPLTVISQVKNKSLHEGEAHVGTYTPPISTSFFWLGWWDSTGPL